MEKGEWFDSWRIHAFFFVSIHCCILILIVYLYYFYGYIRYISTTTVDRICYKPRITSGI